MPEADQSYGLEQIILHHSFKKVKGRTNAISCRERTHIGGTNGAGKTSILQLIPAFYGEEPERIISRASDRESFVDYYLPTVQSLIIFEYRRHTGLCCAVLCRHPQGKLVYRFVEGSARDTFFRPEIKEALGAGATHDVIFAALGEAGVRVSRIIDTITDYRAIIQRNPKLLKRQPSEAKALRALANDFSLGSPTSQMRHIDRLTHVVLNKHRLMSSFKTMLCDTMFDDLHTHKRPEILDERDLVKDIQSIKAFEKEEGRIRDCLGWEAERQLIWNKTARTVNRLRATVEEQTEGRRDLTRTLSTMQAEAEAGETAFNASDSQLGRQCSDLQHNVDTYDTHLQRIHSQNTDYEERGLPQKDQRLRNLQEYKGQQRDADADYKMLTTKVSKLESGHEQQLAQIEKTFNKEQSARQERVTKADQALTKAKHEHEQMLARMDNEKTEEIAQYREDRHTSRRELDSGRVRLETRRDNPGQTPEQARQVQEAEEKAGELDVHSRHIGEQLTDAIKKQEQARNDRKTAQTLLETAERSVEVLDAEFENLRSRLNPGDGTWLSALREQDPQWREGLAKVVNPELLMNPDLSPAFQESSTRRIMGWSIDLSELPVPEIAASEEKILAQLEEKDSQRHNARRAVNEAEKSARKRQDTFRDREKEVERIETEKRILDGSLVTARANLSNTREMIKQAQAQQGNVIKAQLEEVIERLRQFDRDTDFYVKEIANRYAGQRLEQKTLWADKQTDLEAILNNAKELASVAAKEFDERIAKLKTAHAQRLKDEGVNADEVRLAREKKNALEGLISEIEVSENEVRDYRSWKEREWSQVEALQEQCAQYEKELAKAQQRRKEAKATYDTKARAASDAIKTIKQKLKKMNDDMDAAAAILRKYESVPNNSEELPGTLQSLTEELQDAYAKLEGLRNQVIKAFRNSVSLINGYQNTQVHKIWQELKQYQISRLENPMDQHDEAFELAQVENLRDLVDRHLPNLRYGLIDQFTSEADKMEAYFDSLNIMGREIKSVSKKLRQAINTDQQIESLRDIEVVLKPRIYEDDSWHPLKSFVESWRTWKLAHRREIPTDELVKDLQLVVSTLSSARMANNIESMVDMSLQLVENDRLVHIRNDNDFLNASSTGLTYLAIMAIFMGMTRYLAPDLNTRITWPVDELGTLSDNNIAKLADMLEQHNLTMVSACPKLDHTLNKFFENKFRLENGQVHVFESRDTKGATSRNAMFDRIARRVDAQEEQAHAE